jgi:N-acylglucosamine-6-phosphate 2-epimerase
MMTLLERLRGGLIVSVQARAGSALDDPDVLAAMARAAQENGAAGVRIQGVRNLEAVRKRVQIPIVGIIKRQYEGYEPYITPTLREVREVLDSGAEIVAFDATGRPHPEGMQIAEIIAAIHAGRALAMADCAVADDGVCAQAAGADILATTLCGYTKETQGCPLPALDLVRALAQLGSFVICEGGIHAPQGAGEAMQAGADAVVVGTAITNTEWLVRQYAAALALPKSSQP